MPRIDGTAGNDLLIGTSGDDFILGFGGEDTLDGLAGDDWLEGGADADRLLGGPGFDHASYARATTGQVADLATPAANVGTEAAGDTYDGIEALVGSDFADSLRGDGGDNYIFGLQGRDSLYGRGGTDTLVGDNGDDFLEGGEGGDYLIGGAGLDHVLYSSATSGVTVDLLNQSANSGEAAGDFFDSIEGLAGSAFNDSLRGSNANDYLIGEAGSDSLYGRDGNDILIGGAGDDYLTGGAGRDILIGGPGIDLAMYTDAPEGVFVSMVANAGFSGHANGDTLIGIEGVAGSAFDDMINGFDFDDFLYGEGGNDIIHAGRGTDSLIGGRGNDRLNGGGGRDIYVFGVGDGHDAIEYITQDQGASAPPIDIIHLSRALGVSSFQDVMARSQQVGADTVITFDANTSIVIRDFSMPLLGPDNFTFFG